MNPTSIQVTVIICTYNPRRDFIQRTLQALRRQTLAPESWEILLVDNASDVQLSREIDMSWHPNARHLREDKIGKTNALILAFTEAASDLCVIVDDDNLLDQDYLELTLQLSKAWSILGAWGGQSLPEYETSPPEWSKPHLWMLAIREFTEDRWSNLPHCYETAPFGAGMTIRKHVALGYVELVKTSALRVNLDPKGKELLRCGDLDMAFTACDLGLGTGIFAQLKLTHLMPSFRLQESYLLKLSEGNGYSLTILESFRGKLPEIPKSRLKQDLYEFYVQTKMNPLERKFRQAFVRGRTRALQAIAAQ
jgi:hypothetical protein